MAAADVTRKSLLLMKIPDGKSSLQSPGPRNVLKREKAFSCSKDFIVSFPKLLTSCECSIRYVQDSSAQCNKLFIIISNEYNSDMSSISVISMSEHQNVAHTTSGSKTLGFKILYSESFHNASMHAEHRNTGQSQHSKILKRILNTSFSLSYYCIIQVSTRV